VEAYLFDSRLKQKGKWNSFRLELYVTDSAVAMAGRGYLGKGVLRGRLTSDSLEVYFPTTNEFVYEETGSLLSSMECAIDTPGLDFGRLLSVLPDEFALDPRLSLDTDYSKSNRPRFTISDTNCDWRLQLIYDQRKVGWRLREFRFDDGSGRELTGKRREFRDRARVRLNKFHWTVPDDAVRIIP
jgi:hypothetical protein